MPPNQHVFGYLRPIQGHHLLTQLHNSPQLLRLHRLVLSKNSQIGVPQLTNVASTRKRVVINHLQSGPASELCKEGNEYLVPISTGNQPSRVIV